MRLLHKQGKGYREVAVSVLASSLEAVPMTEEYARVVAPLLVAQLGEESSNDHTEQLLTCLLHISRLVELPDIEKVARRCGEVIKSKAATPLLHSALSLLLAVGEKRADSSLFEPLVVVFASSQSELKFDALSLLLDLVANQPVGTVRDCAATLRAGLFDIVRAKKREPLWAVMRLTVLITRKVGGNLLWAVGGKSEGFFPLLIGLVGVEVSLAFDRPQIGQDSLMLMACVEVLETVMQGLRGDEETDESVMKLLQLREKLNDICRVALEFLIETSSDALKGEDLRPLVATKLVSSWACLDPEAFQPKEVVSLMPVVVARLPWFIPVLADHWAAEDDLRDAFVLANGVEKLCRLLEERLPTVAKDPENAHLEEWGSECVVNSFDSIISGLSVLVTCASARKTLNLVSSCDGLLKVLLESARLLMGRRDAADCSSLLGFVVAAIAQLLRIDAPISDVSLRNRAAMVIALYLPVAAVSEGLSTLLAVADCVENNSKGDGKAIADAVAEVGSADLLRDTLRTSFVTSEQTAAISRLLKALKK